MLGLSSIFLFNFFLHVFCNTTKTSANSSGVVLWLRKPSKKERIDFVILFFIITKLIIGFVSDPIMLGMGAQDSWVTVGH